MRKVSLTPYDEELLQDRSHIPLPSDGFVEEGDLEEGGWSDAVRAPPLRTHVAFGLYFCAVLLLPAAVVTNYFLALPNWVPFAIAFESLAALQLLLLLLAAVLEAHLQFKHAERARLGFLDFGKASRPLVRMPLLVATAATAAALAIDLWDIQLPAIFHIQVGQLDLMMAVLCAQCLAVAVAGLAYSTVVWRHNAKEVRQGAPDALRYLRAAQASYSPPLYVGAAGASGGMGGATGGAASGACPPADVGPPPDYRLRGAGGLLRVVEQQAEVIRILERHKEGLQGEVLRLQAAAHRRSEAAGAEEAAACSGLRQLLVAKDREITCLAGEKEALAKEGAGTWQLLDEREGEIHRLQLTRQQQLEENSRVRATLEEWSQRNARLEHRLLAMRSRLDQANEELQQLKDGQI